MTISPTPAGVRLQIRVIPRAPRNEVGGIRDGRLLVRVTAPPVDSAANEAVVALIADVLSRPKRHVRIVSGETSRNKTIEILGITSEHLRTLPGFGPSG